MKKICSNMIISSVLFLVFTVFTVLVMKFDVRMIGPEGSHVGFSTVNQFVFEKLGVNLLWYEITDWLGIVAILVAVAFGIMGLLQWIRRKSIFKVDEDILAMGVYYSVIVALYMIFEIYIVNYRPILLHGNLEASFPSSHTMIVLSILGVAIIQFQNRIKHCLAKKVLSYFAGGIMIITIVGRLISGVHWFTDIISGLLLAGALVMLYSSVLKLIEYKKGVY